MVLIKEIELALNPKNTEVVAQEDDLITDSVLELANTDFTQQDEYEDVTPGSIRKHVEADMRVAYPGKPTSRQRIFTSFNENKDSKLLERNISCNHDKSDEDRSVKDDLDIMSNVSSEEEDSDIASNKDAGSIQSSDLDDDQESEEDGDSSDFGGSITEFEKYSKLSSGTGEEAVKSEDDSQGIDIFPVSVRDIKDDIAKGKSIRNQLTIWEKLIECRIKLQPGLIAANRLFQGEALKEFKSQLAKEDEETVLQAYSVLSDLMKGLLELQDVTSTATPEYREMKIMKRKNDTTDEGPKEKKKNYDLLQELHENFKPFKNSAIQKWNEKTRVSHGRMSKSDFSAFDQPTLKQIEEILLDQDRLLKRTRTKRSDYQVLGKNKTSDESSKGLQEYDPEIFDDDDFYHKLLRDFIENKTSDASDASKRGRQWLELQKLRTRMKAKVDTRASKGRKIRYTVHPKMVNFMAPVPSYSWTDGAKTELFNSLFGQALLQKA